MTARKLCVSEARSFRYAFGRHAWFALTGRQRAKLRKKGVFLGRRVAAPVAPQVPAANGPQCLLCGRRQPEPVCATCTARSTSFSAASQTST